MVITVIFRAQKSKNSAWNSNDTGNNDTDNNDTGNNDTGNNDSNDDDVSGGSRGGGSCSGGTWSGLSNGTKKWSKSNDYNGEMSSQTLSHFRARTL